MKVKFAVILQEVERRDLPGVTIMYVIGTTAPPSVEGMVSTHPAGTAFT